ncbi:MAG TPA: kelch repeat-containing protein, partial [Polyangiaceae bacterium]
MLRNKIVGLLLAGTVSCGQLDAKVNAKLDEAGDVITKASAKVPDVKQYAKDLEEKIRNLDVQFEMQTVRYDPKTKEFTNLTPPPTERNLFAVEQIGGKLYVLGGLDADGDYVNTLEAYDPTTDSWSTRSSWPHPGFAFVEKVGELLCAIGGYKNLDEPIRRDVDCYDPATDVWQAGAPVPEAYSSFYPVVQGGKVYLL